MKLLMGGLLGGMGTGVIRWLQQLANYFDRHRDWIHHDRHLAAGYPIASGVIEGARRPVVKDGMERTGMRWTPLGAQTLLKSNQTARRRS
ncbi:MAG: hypothetical protein IPM89_02790 [Candidatus Competibacteraceae bacterium]|nr:MAG: hypothetical protein IPM89_02790 [Candidatus Competibacteraceae bacterium]